MAELDTLKSYLISLGFAVDIASYRKMNQLLDQQKKMVMNSTGVMSNSYVKAGKTIAGVLVAVGAATVTLMDKVAKADLGYDLFGMKMYMTADAAKKVKIAVDALGYSMDEIAWNPELKKRFDDLIALQGGLQGKLGPDYKKAMQEIRDIRFEFTKMKVEGEYAAQVLVYRLFKAFGVEAKDVKETLQKINDWIMNQMIPSIEELVGQFKSLMNLISPLLVDAFTDLKGVAKDVSSALNSIFNVMSRGESENAGFVDWVGAVAYVITGLAHAVIFAGKAMVGMGKAWAGLTTGRLDWTQEGWKDMVDAWTAYQDYTNLDKRASKALQEAADRAAGKRRQNRGAGGSWDSVGGSGSWGSEQPKTASPGISKFKDLLSQYFPGQEHVAASIMKAESGGDPRAHNPEGGGTGAFGLFQIRGQLHREALTKAGIIKSDNDLFDPVKNFQAARFLYDRAGWQPWNSSKKNWDNALNTNTTNNVTVHVTQPNATADQIAEATRKKLEDLERRRTQRQIRELGGVMG